MYNELTNEELLALANYDAGPCMCGHFESCAVCSRSESTRKMERIAKRTALELLAKRGVSVMQKQVTGRPCWVALSESRGASGP